MKKLLVLFLLISSPAFANGACFDSHKFSETCVVTSSSHKRLDLIAINKAIAACESRHRGVDINVDRKSIVKCIESGLNLTGATIYTSEADYQADLQSGFPKDKPSEIIPYSNHSGGNKLKEKPDTFTISGFNKNAPKPQVTHLYRNHINRDGGQEISDLTLTTNLALQQCAKEGGKPDIEKATGSVLCWPKK